MGKCRPAIVNSATIMGNGSYRPRRQETRQEKPPKKMIRQEQDKDKDQGDQGDKTRKDKKEKTKTRLRQRLRRQETRQEKTKIKR